MEFRDLKSQYQKLKPEIDIAIQKVLNNANYISGNEVKELEKELAEYVGVKHCITCANGTDALVLALKTWGIGVGDAVFVPDFTFFASAEAPAICGATPVFVDVERDTFNISPDSLEQAIQFVLEKGELIPKAIIAVDLFGQPADYIEIRKIADKYGLYILEDGAQGFGGRIGEKKACSFGDISTTSFFPAKPLGCYGDGGAIFTDNDEWNELIRSYCVHGKGKNKYDNVRIGMNSRLDTLQAAILQVKLKVFKEYELGAVNQVAEWYSKYLNNAVITPIIREDYYSSWAQYTIVCENICEREVIQKKLKENNIPSMVYYVKGMHEQKAFIGSSDMIIDYKNTNYLKEKVLSLPIHAYMQESDVYNICQCIKKICKKL